MKKLLTVAALGLFCVSGMAQEAEKKEGFTFTVVKENPITSIKNQNRAGTCWCYSSLAFIESELLRLGKGEFDLSEMFLVHNTYLDRADKAVRTHGDVSFSQGGSFYDVLYGMETFGLVPEAEMRPGVMYGDSLSNHTELSAVSDAVVAAIAKGRLRSLQKVRQGGFPLQAVMIVKGILIPDGAQEFKLRFLCPDAGLLKKLSDDGLTAGLPCLGGAAGVFPGACEALASGPAGQEDLAPSVVHPDTDHQSVFTGLPGGSPLMDPAGEIPVLIIDVIKFQGCSSFLPISRVQSSTRSPKRQYRLTVLSP